MLTIINRIFLIILLLAVLAGIFVGVMTIFLPGLFEGDGELKYTESLAGYPDFILEGNQLQHYPADSPYVINFTIKTPPLRNTDLVFLDIYSEGKRLVYVNCLEDLADGYTGRTEVNCSVPIPYDYNASAEYRVFAILSTNGVEYAAGPMFLTANWADYEDSFLGFSFFLIIAILITYFLILLPVTLIVLRVAAGMKHVNASPGEYSLRSLILPFEVGKTLLEKLNSFLVSPYFWAFEFIGIIIILLYMAISAQIWKSYTALFAFLFSGLLAFIVPYLWCAIWWYADYREREPLRILVTFFLWGMLAALMAIGINSIAGVLFGFLGFGFISTFLVAPVVEECYKGAGLCLLSGHHEYDSIEDGFVFGFVIGMGFSFIENWIYFIGNPMGSDILGWVWLFLLRSIIFSANHGFYTAITGGVIGYLIERKFHAPALGLLIGFPIAAFFHAMHNSSAVLTTLLGVSGVLVYCCLLIPIFDYGGLILLLAFFILSLFRQKPR